MKRLPEKFTKYGFHFEQVCRTENTAIYRQHITDRAQSYEVIIIRVANRKPVAVGSRIKWIEAEAYECYPPSAKWGESGWTYTTEEDARARYDLLNASRCEVPVALRYPTTMSRLTDGIAQECVFLSGSVRTAEAAKTPLQRVLEPA